MTHDDVQAWLDRYVAAWSSYDPEAIGDAVHRRRRVPLPPVGDDPVRGREAIVANWLEHHGRARDVGGASYDVWALDGDRASADRREPLHEPRRLVPDALLQQLASPLRRPRPLRRLRRVLHGAARAAARGTLTDYPTLRPRPRLGDPEASQTTTPAPAAVRRGLAGARSCAAPSRRGQFALWYIRSMASAASSAASMAFSSSL